MFSAPIPRLKIRACSSIMYPKRIQETTGGEAGGSPASSLSNHLDSLPTASSTQAQAALSSKMTVHAGDLKSESLEGLGTVGDDEDDEDDEEEDEDDEEQDYTSIKDEPYSVGTDDYG